MSGNSKPSLQWAFNAAFGAAAALIGAGFFFGAFVLQLGMVFLAFALAGSIASQGASWFTGWARGSGFGVAFATVCLIALLKYTHSGVVNPLLAVTAGSFTGLGIGLIARYRFW